MHPEDTQKYLLEAYPGYFKEVRCEKIGGKGRIHHVTACRTLVKRGVLVETKDGFMLASRRKRRVRA